MLHRIPSEMTGLIHAVIQQESCDALALYSILHKFSTKQYRTMKTFPSNRRRLAVIGDPIAHSLSPALQNFLIAHFDLPFHYEAARVSSEGLPAFVQRMRTGEFAGANVTLPHKQTVVSLLDELTPSAQSMGAVNTIVCEAGLLRGYNTDAPGFTRCLQAAGVAIKNQAVLVLGAGGAATAVVHALLAAGVGAIYICNREAARAKKICEKISRGNSEKMRLLKWEEREDWLRLRPVTMIINATSAGMPPQQNVSPLSRSAFYAGLHVVDLIYRPRETLFLREAKQAGALTWNGLPMLIYQGVAALELWSRQQFECSHIYAEIERRLCAEIDS